ncbi:MAG: aldehyde dehydrogenase, partial [Acidobacteria bacterium]|nr:aldehyde dehydrogenase [Acidobacteriota bacterium]
PEPRRSRSALLNMVPTASHAAEAVGEVLPELAGRIEGFVVRVPAPHGALLDLVAQLDRPAGAEEVRRAFRRAAAKDPAGILAVTEEELVSGDFIGDPHSAVVDLPLIQVVEGGLVRVVAWYDNEWGYANRLAELLVHLGRRGKEGGES